MSQYNRNEYLHQLSGTGLQNQLKELIVAIGVACKVEHVKPACGLSTGESRSNFVQTCH